MGPFLLLGFGPPGPGRGGPARPPANSAAFTSPAAAVAVPHLRWRTADARAVARGIATDRAFHRLPILADALMDAGCDDERILGCCRGERRLPGKCWVVEEILRAGRP